MSNLSKPAHIAIVGGSLAGLMTAVPLRKLGHKVTILERSPVPLLHDQGAGIVAGGDTLDWVQKHGRTRTTADDISVLSQWRYYLDIKGNVIDRENSHQRMTSWGMLYNLGRQNFDGMTRKSANLGQIENLGKEHGNGSGRYEYGRNVTAVQDMGDKLKVTFRQAREDSNEGGEESEIICDFLIVADGPSTRLRQCLLGDGTAQRTYAGYVAFRGTVSEANLSAAAKDVFVEKFSFFHGQQPNTQILAYTIPNAEESLTPGQRLVNWVWYHNVKFDSDEYAEIMTDKHGQKHRFTLPTGGFMQAKVWERQKRIGESRLPPQFAELVLKTEKPFVQAITDLEPPKTASQAVGLLDGKALIMGDAYSGFRPHTAASTSQAAFQALRLEEVFKGEVDWREYEDVVFKYASRLQAHGVRLGDRSQFGTHPLAGN